MESDSGRTTGRPGLARTAWLALGLIFVALGLVGAVLPLMPTTIFLILAAGCFARSSPPLEAWLMTHQRFGSALRAWRTHGAVPRRAKLLAVSGMVLGYGLFEWTAHPSPWLSGLTAAILAGCAVWLVSRPTPPAALISES